MRIKSLHISNFKCFEAFDISFAPGTTVLIGRNGAGKSAVLSALKMALSFIFASNKSLGDDYLSAGIPKLSVNTFSQGDFKIDFTSHTIASNASIKADAVFNGKSLEWELYKKSTAKAALEPDKYKQAFQTFISEWKVNRSDLPLLAYFSDAFPHRDTKQTKQALELIQLKSVPNSFGYYEWDKDESCTYIWEIRLCNRLAHLSSIQNQEVKLFDKIYKVEQVYSIDVLKNNAKYQEAKDAIDHFAKIKTPHAYEVDYVQERLIHFSNLLPALQGNSFAIEYLTLATVENGYALNFVFKDGKESLLQNLPAGYNRLFSIVLDIAYRAFILNGGKEPEGVVIIDEIDLHLHPSLEQEVVRCLREVFPRIQFVISTHSAAVISNLNSVEKDDTDNAVNTVLFMQSDNQRAEPLPNIYGLDYNSALRDFMDTPSRNQEAKILGDEYLAYCSYGLKEEAKSTYNKILAILGSAEHPYISELRQKSQIYEVH